MKTATLIAVISILLPFALLQENETAVQNELTPRCGMLWPRKQSDWGLGIGSLLLGVAKPIIDFLIKEIIYFKDQLNKPNSCKTEDGKSSEKQMVCCPAGISGCKICICLAGGMTKNNSTFDLTLTSNKKPLINSQVPVTTPRSEPPRFCVSLPFVRLLELCLDIYSFRSSGNSFSACIKVSFRVGSEDVFTIDLNCHGIDDKGNPVINVTPPPLPTPPPPPPTTTPKLTTRAHNKNPPTTTTPTTTTSSGMMGGCVLNEGVRLMICGW